MTGRPDSGETLQKHHRKVTRSLTVGATLVLVWAIIFAAVASWLVSDTEAAWHSSQHSQSTPITAGSVPAVESLSCAGVGLLNRANLTWNPPTTEAPIVGYQVTVDGETQELPANQRTFNDWDLFVLELLNTYTVEVRAVAEGGWVSQEPETVSVTATSLLGIPLLTLCN